MAMSQEHGSTLQSVQQLMKKNQVQQEPPSPRYRSSRLTGPPLELATLSLNEYVYYSASGIRDVDLLQ